MTTTDSTAGWAKPLAQEYSVVYHNPKGTGRGLDGPGLVKLADGSLVAAVPVRFDHGWQCEMLRSTDGGASWELQSELPYFCVVPWEYAGQLYLFAQPAGKKHRIDDLLLLRSSDGAATWSEPVKIYGGHCWNCQTGMVFRDSRIYWAIDDLSPGPKQRGPRMVVGDLSGDILNPQAWRVSNLVEFPGLPDSLVHPDITSDYPSVRMLEPNVLEVNGRLRVLAAVKPPMQATTNLCAVFDVRDDGSDVTLEFTQFHPMPGGQVKFCTVWDEVSQLFWAAVNLAVDGQDQYHMQDEREHRGDGAYAGAIGGNDRRFLMLVYGLDGLNWFPAGCIARAGRLSQSFMYPTNIIDGDDMLVIARSSINGDNRHDADYATLHRVRDFRRLALNLRQDTDG